MARRAETAGIAGNQVTSPENADRPENRHPAKANQGKATVDRRKEKVRVRRRAEKAKAKEKVKARAKERRSNEVMAGLVKTSRKLG